VVSQVLFRASFALSECGQIRLFVSLGENPDNPRRKLRYVGFLGILSVNTTDSIPRKQPAFPAPVCWLTATASRCRQRPKHGTTASLARMFPPDNEFPGAA
jgi:hypothetical protein